MSENLQQNQGEYVIQNFQYELNPNDVDLVDAMNMYTGKFPTDLLASSQNYSCDEYGNEPLTWRSAGDSSYFDANAKVHNDLNIVRDCLGHRMQSEEQAIDSLWEGKSDE